MAQLPRSTGSNHTWPRVIGPMNTATIRLRDGNTLPPRIDLIHVDSAGRIVIEFFAAANRSYDMESSPALFPSEWHVVGTVVPQPEGRVVAVTNQLAAGVRQGFFRVVTP